MNLVFTIPMSTKTIRKELRKQNISDELQFKKFSLMSKIPAVGISRFQVINSGLQKSGKTVICPDESCFNLFSIFSRVNVCQMSSKAYNTDCVLLRVKHGGCSLMIQTDMSWFSVVPMITLHRNIFAKTYVNILVY